MMTPPPSKKDLHLDELATLSHEQIVAVPTMLFTPGRTSFELTMVRQPESAAAEQYRLLAHTIEKQHALRPGTTVAVSSAVAGEGKTITSLNLAFALTETKSRKVALCDLDLRGGRLADALGLGEIPGITDVLAGRKPASEVIRKIDKNLTFVPSGFPVPHTVGMLRSSAWHVLVQSLRANFDVIVLDCPPICMSDDMSVVDDVVDRMLLVVRSGVSTQEAVRDALNRVPPEKLVGLVLNDAPFAGKAYRPYKREI